MNIFSQTSSGLHPPRGSGSSTKVSGDKMEVKRDGIASENTETIQQARKHCKKKALFFSPKPIWDFFFENSVFMLNYFVFFGSKIAKNLALGPGLSFWRGGEFLELLRVFLLLEITFPE